MFRKCAPLDREVLPLDETAASKFVQKGYVYRRMLRKRQQDTQTIGAPRLLRPRCKRPRDCGAAEQRDELTPPHSITS